MSSQRSRVAVLLAVTVVALAWTAVPAPIAAQAPTLISNPYRNVDWDRFNSYKAQLHMHTTESDGRLSVANALNSYISKNYEIIAITDHSEQRVTAPTWRWENYSGFSEIPSIVNTNADMETSAFYSKQGTSGVLAIKGNELSACVGQGHHIISLFSDVGYPDCPSTDLSVYWKDITAKNGVALYAHPTVTGQYDRTGIHANDVSWYEEVFANHRKKSLYGMEVINGYEHSWAGPASWYFDLWDRLNRLKDYHDMVWGFGTDDMHDSHHLYYAWTTFYMSENTESSLRDAIDTGAFTFSFQSNSNGDDLVPALVGVEAGRNKITISCKDETSIEWYNSDSELIATGNSLDVRDIDSKFVRAKISNSHGDTYTQPFGLHVIPEP